MQKIELVSPIRPDAENPHVRLDEREVVPTRPRRRSLFHKRITAACLGLALTMMATLAWAEAAGSNNASVAVSSGIWLVSAEVSDVSAGVVFDARWHTSNVSNADLLNRTWGMMIIFR